MKVLAQILDHAFTGHSALALSKVAESVVPIDLALPYRIYLRKRPLLQYEVDAGDWDAISVDARRRLAVLHDGRLARSGRRLGMTHRQYHFDTVWTADDNDDVVFASAVEPLVTSAQQGQSATLVMYVSARARTG
jgi:hypothetical protein